MIATIRNLGNNNGDHFYGIVGAVVAIISCSIFTGGILIVRWEMGRVELNAPPRVAVVSSSPMVQ